MKLKPYPKYKESGVQWIGEIPEEWELERFKIRFKSKKGKIPENLDVTNGDGYLPYLSMEYLRGKEENALFSNDPKALKVEEDDLLLLWDGSNAGEFISAKKGFLSSTMVKLSIEGMNKSFSKYLCSAFEPMLRDLTVGMGIPHVNGDILGNIQIPIFELTDQQKISSFLDLKTSEISKTIEADKKLIELLKEKRTALINHVVTKGLNPKAKMKDSGIEWIGEVPEGWEVDRMKFLVSKINSGVTPSGGAKVYTDEGIPLLRSQNVHFDGLRLDDVAYIPEEIHNAMPNSVVKKHDILINITGASIGRCTYVEEEFKKANVNQHVCIIRPKKIYYKYLAYYLMSRLGQDQVFSVQMGTSREGLNFQQLGDFIIFYPSIGEQQKIVEYIESKTYQIFKTIQKIEKKIELLEEYKKSLIHHVVTGKVDVRGAIA